MTPEGYLTLTEPVVTSLYDALKKSDVIIEGVPSIFDYQDSDGVIRMPKDVSQEIADKFGEYLFYGFSRATVCGSILQIAYMGIKLFSTNASVPESCKGIGFNASTDIQDGTLAAKYCIGRDIHNLPIGILIFASRNQYNHWEEGRNLRSPTKEVFEELYNRYSSKATADLIFALGHGEPEPKSHYIVLNELRWTTYDEYLNDMNSLILPDSP